MEFYGEVIKSENEIELLGIPIRADLKLDEFVNEKAKKCTKKLAMLRKLNISALSVRKQLAVSTVLAPLDYGNALLTGASKKTMERCEKIIRSVVRYISRLNKFDDTKQKQRDLHILGAKDRSKFKVMLLTWKVLHFNEPKILVDCVPVRKVNVTLRSSEDNLEDEEDEGDTGKTYTTQY